MGFRGLGLRGRVVGLIGLRVRVGFQAIEGLGFKGMGDARVERNAQSMSMFCAFRI